MFNPGGYCALDRPIKSGDDSGLEMSASHPAFRARAAERCAFFAGRDAARRAGECAARFAEALPFRLCFNASIRLMTLSGFSSGSAP